jgi:hypothetical protein
MTKAYPSNLTWEQWELIAELFPKEKPGGRPRTVAMYAIVNAILYVLCSLLYVGVAELRYDLYDLRDVLVTPFGSLERD